jgi:hypothetical protein
MPISSKHPYIEYESSEEWRILDAELTELVRNNDLVEQTDRRYIVGALCKALAQKGRA